ncbi:hypothetical protein Tco_1041522 [Tanacetum coccineum]|uniref:Transposase n=1 Tax=Tanacetum coccineum TaxID=301880 RepID=A0ABQ5GIT5_9ASTR
MEQVKAHSLKNFANIIEKTVVNEQLEAETRWKSNKSIHIFDEQKNLYKALVDAYKSDNLILDTYGDTISFKRRRDDEDKDEEPSAGSNRGSKRRRAGKKPESTSAPKEKTSKTSGKSYEGSKSQHKTAGESAQTEEPMHTTKDLEEPAHQEFETGVTEDQHNEETPQYPDWFQKPTKLPSPDLDWNKDLPDALGHVQPWLSSLAQKEDPRESFNELMDTPLDFSTFVMNRVKSLVELEYLFEEVYKATTEQLDWNNPKVTKTKDADYGHIKWIEDLIPNRMWSQVLGIDMTAASVWGQGNVNKFTVFEERLSLLFLKNVYKKRCSYKGMVEDLY